ncbi:unnamed protein product [Amoebophrya sp. A120]|nr:unnamed protein product [Amoebophrya sp. A120]|eukprot:GSA120T00014455001.1
MNRSSTAHRCEKRTSVHFTPPSSRRLVAEDEDEEAGDYSYMITADRDRAEPEVALEWIGIGKKNIGEPRTPSERSRFFGRSAEQNRGSKKSDRILSRHASRREGVSKPTKEEAAVLGPRGTSNYGKLDAQTQEEREGEADHDEEAVKTVDPKKQEEKRSMIAAASKKKLLSGPQEQETQERTDSIIWKNVPTPESRW